MLRWGYASTVVGGKKDRWWTCRSAWVFLDFIIYVIFDINKEISSKEFMGIVTPNFLALRMKIYLHFFEWRIRLEHLAKSECFLQKANCAQAVFIILYLNQFFHPNWIQITLLQWGNEVFTHKACRQPSKHNCHPSIVLL